MDEQIRQIAERLKGLRDALDMTEEEVAADCGLTVDEYRDLESGECDLSISILQRIAHKYGITLDELMFGEEPKMDSYFLTRKGTGISVERVKAYKYELLASGFKHRMADPFIVTIEPKPEDTPLFFNEHEGQEFHFVIELPEDLENCPTIKLIVQPIVENSIYHGIKYLQDEGLISISVMEKDGKTIAISVKDNGVGMSADVAASLLDKNSSHQHLSDGNGIGLQNIDERIKLSYGDEYGLTIHSELDEGTEVIITIPKLSPITPVVIKR